MATIGLVMRFKNCAGTLPAVLRALASQTRRPDVILGVDNRSDDGSRALLAAHGARFLEWNRPYHVGRVLNTALASLDTDLVIVLSAHTVLHEPDAFARFEACFADPQVACAAHVTPALARYTHRVTWSEMVAKGMTRGSIYSNSSGCLRRAWWREHPFDERIAFGAEDYDWALGQLRRGRVARLLPLVRSYLRPKPPPYIHLRTSRTVHAIAHKHGLRCAFGDASEFAAALCWFAKTGGFSRKARVHLKAQVGWIWGGLTWRRHDPFRAPALAPAPLALDNGTTSVA